MAPNYRSLLEEALEARAYTREGVLAELQNLPAGRFDLRPVAEARSVADLARHLLEADLLAAGELCRPDGDFSRKPFPELLDEYASHVDSIRSKDELVRALERSLAEGDARFREAGELFLLQFIRRFDGQPGTRLAWVWHAIDHESYHRGQLALYARLFGMVPALTQQIHGAARTSLSLSPDPDPDPEP